MTGGSVSEAARQATSTEQTHPLHGRWLFVARASWIVLTLVGLALVIAMIPRYDAALLAPCHPEAICVGFQPSAYDYRLLHQLGLSLDFVAAWQVGWSVAAVVIFDALAALIFWRRSSDWMALLCSFMLVLFGGGAPSNVIQYTLMLASPVWFVIIGVFYVLGESGFLVFFLVFPSGRFVPRWTRWVAVAFVLYWVFQVFSENIFINQGIFSNLVFSALLLCAVGAQIYRYRRVSTPIERQQTKWVVFGFAVGILGFVLLLLLANFFLPPNLLQSQVAGALFSNPLFSGFIFLIPLSITIAVLHSRLYDIDVIINRTLVYGSLSAVLAAIYFACVIGTQTVIQALTGQTNTPPVFIVASTLLIAALFTPLRRRIQTSIDRRFYRRKHDVQKTLAAFGATLRQEVELADLQAHLVTIVEETMQPTHISLWLRPHKQHTESKV